MMVGISSRGIRLGILFLLLIASTALADAPVTSYDCAPGTPIRGVGCSCPKQHADGKAYTSKRDPADEGKAICVGAAAATRPVPGPRPPTANSYDTLVAQANDAADAYNCTKAEELYQKALQVNAKGLEALVGSGNCMAKQSKWTNAHLKFDKALSINAKYEPALWAKAEAYRLAYKKDDAIAAYRQYLDAFPTAYKAKQALEKLQGGAPVVTPPPTRPDPVPTTRPGRFPSRTQDVNLTISGTQITANGVAVSGTPQLADWVGIYGKADRVWDKGGVNKVHTWDKLGLIIYEPLDGRAISATFPFKPMSMAYDPSTMFGGVIVVDGYTFGPTTSLGDLKARPGATTPYSAGSVVFPKGDFNVFTTGKTGTIELVEISMWKNGKPAAPVVAGGKYSSTKDLKIAITGTSVSMNGTAVSGKPYLKDIEAIYGKADRTWDSGGGGGNRVHTWDKLGLVIYEPKDGRAVSATFPYRTVSTNYDPTTWFGGTITVDGHTMPPTVDIATVKGWAGAGQPYGADSIVFDKGDIHVFTTAKQKGGGIDLVEISFWQKDKAAPPPTTTPPPVEAGGTNNGIAAADVRVEVTSAGSVKIQNIEVGGRPMLADFVKIYGKPDRVWDKKGAVNRIHTWDKIGVLVYEPHNGRATSFTMTYKPMTGDFAPKSLFGGRVSLDGRGFYKFNTIGVLKTRPGATQPYGTDSLVFDFGDVHIFTKASAATVETIELVEISFWQKK